MNISFVIPVWNNKKYLRRCIQAILAQEFIDEYEVIVVDNGSTDECVKTISDLPVRIVYEAKQGRSYARNSGWRLARFELVAFVDSDTMLERDWAANVIKGFYHSSIGCLQGQVIPARETVDSLQRYRYHLAFNSRLGMFCDIADVNPDYPCINTAACCYRKITLIDLQGFNESLQICEDTDLSRRAYAAGWSVSHVSEAKAYCYWHGNGWWDYYIRALGFYRKHLDFKCLWGEFFTEEDENKNVWQIWKRNLNFFYFPDTRKPTEFLVFEFFTHYVSRFMLMPKLLTAILEARQKGPVKYPPLIRRSLPGSDIPKFIDNSKTIVLLNQDNSWLVLQGQLRSLFLSALKDCDKGGPWSETLICQYLGQD